MNTPNQPPPSPVRVLEVKRDPWVAIPFLLVVAAVIAAAAFHKITVDTAALILMALGVPSMVGVRTMPALVTALVAELQKQIASLPPPPQMPTGTEPQAGLSVPPDDELLPLIITPITEEKERKP